MKMLIMRPEQPHETREVERSQCCNYAGLRKLLRPLLDGADMEHVTVWASLSGKPPFKRSDMFVDELSAVKRLPKNAAATLIYRRATMMSKTGMQPPENPDDLPAIYGPAILFEDIVWT